MSYLHQLRQKLLPPAPSRSPAPPVDHLRQALEAGLRARRAEAWQPAAEAFESALSAAHTAPQASIVALIVSNLAEVFVRLGRTAEADQLLATQLMNAQTQNQPDQVAYLLLTQGWLGLERGELESTRELYERGLSIAKKTNALGLQGRAEALLGDLYLRDNNASYAIYLLREALPKLNAAGEIDLSSFFVGRLGEALLVSGKTQEGEALLTRALRLAEQFDDRTWQRHWQRVWGEYALAQLDYRAADIYLRQAWRLSSTTPPQAAKVRLACQLTKVQLALRDVVTAQAFAEQAAEFSAVLNDPLLQQQSQAALGVVAALAEQPAKALAHLQQVQTCLPTFPFSQTDVVRHTAVVQAALGDWEAAQANIAQAKHLAQTVSAEERAAVLRDAGLIAAQQGQPQEAIRCWLAAVPLFEQVRRYAAAARLLCEIAAKRKFLGERYQKDIENALLLVNHLTGDDESKGLVLSAAANLYVELGDNQSAEQFFNETLQLAKRVGNEAAEITRRGNYAWMLLSFGQTQQAVPLLEYAVRQAREQGLALPLAVQTHHLAWAYDMQAQYPRAIGIYREALRLVSGLGQVHWEHFIAVSLANAVLRLGHQSDARTGLQAAREYARMSGDAEILVRALTGLGRLALAQSDDAQVHLDEAIALARRADLRWWLADALWLYSEMQAQKNLGEMAVQTWEEARKLYALIHHPQAKLKPVWLSPSA